MMTLSTSSASLSGDEQKQLNAVYKNDERAHVRIRAHAILLMFDRGRCLQDVANILAVHKNTVRNWLDRWSEEGLDGLYDLPGRGAKPIFSEAEEKLILGYLEEEPRSSRKLAALIEQRLGKKVHPETLRGILKKHGKSWKRQRKILSKEPTPEELEQGKADLEELKQMEQDGEHEILYFDASGFTLQPYVPYAWQDLGRDGTIGIPSSSSKRINVLGFLSPAQDDLITFNCEGKVNSAVFIEAMDSLCAIMTQPAVVILDNAPIHTSKAVAAKIPEWERQGVSLYYLPRYSPHLNLIEMVWRKMKYEWIPNWAYQTITTLNGALLDIADSFGDKYKIQFRSYS